MFLLALVKRRGLQLPGELFIFILNFRFKLNFYEVVDIELTVLKVMNFLLQVFNLTF